MAGSDVPAGARVTPVKGLLLGTLLALLCSVAWMVRPLPSGDALARFESPENWARPAPCEEIRTDALVRAGAPVFPLLEARILQRDYPWRLDVIAFLGESGDRGSIAALRTLLLDRSESSPARAQALYALLSIDPSVGRDLASQVSTEGGLVGQTASALRDRLDAGTFRSAGPRSYWQAIFHTCG